MRNLNKITPIVIKSIIENNDFNQFQPWRENDKYQIGELHENSEEMLMIPL